MMNSTVPSARSLRPFLLAFFLAMGAILAWTFLYTFVENFVRVWVNTEYITENIEVTREGEVLIASYQQGVRVFRTLDGTPVDRDNDQRDASIGYVGGFGAVPRARLGWSERIMATTDGRRQPTYWYLIHDGLVPGHAYLQGFDSVSAHCVGYLGTRGFRPDLPAPDELFALNGFRLGELTSSTGGSENGAIPQGTYVQRPAMMYVASGDQLYLIELAQRTLRQVAVDEPIFSLVLMSGRPLATPVAEEEEARRQRILLRTPEALLIATRDGQIEQMVPIPPEAREKYLVLYQPLGDGFLLSSSEISHSHLTIYWLDAQGAVTRQRDVELLRSHLRDQDRVGWSSVATTPALLVELLGVGGQGMSVAESQGTTILEAVQRILARSWGELTALAMLSLLLAAVAFARQRQLGMPFAGGWAAFVLLLGVPGFMAYWAHRRRPPRARCPQSGALVSRDRAQCMACAGEFPRPRRLGSEVFA